ncbi:MAG: SEC-C metal-binding domain-containing protein [Candidatus Krumholzibacteriia bacterium]
MPEGRRSLDLGEKAPPQRTCPCGSGKKYKKCCGK